jgi:hypothetical protein
VKNWAVILAFVAGRDGVGMRVFRGHIVKKFTKNEGSLLIDFYETIEAKGRDQATKNEEEKNRNNRT